ncbi:MAG: PxKF domain-containing protein, partial [Actinomycetota bacterium]|nr:PxKF domain-containing protein [Actinomycetota bacterium]
TPAGRIAYLATTFDADGNESIDLHIPGDLPTAPDPPTGVTVAAGDSKAAVSWTAPADDGGSAITGYVVTSHSADPDAPTPQVSTPDGQTSMVTIDTLKNDASYTFTVTATNALGTSAPSDTSNVVTPRMGATDPVIVSEPVDGNATSATTVTAGATDPTASEPLTTSVEVPPGTGGGTVTIAQTAIDQVSPSGYSFLGQQINITAPAATPDNPLTLVFTLDATLAAGQTPTSLQVFRTEGGVTQGPIPGCTGPGAVPDPCASNRGYVNGTDIQITILTSQASAWNFGVMPYQFSGFFSPVANPPALNTLKAGSTSPMKFSLHGNKGLAIFATGYPKVQSISCTTLASTGALASASGTLAYNKKTDQYTYSWKTAKSWAGTCRQLVVKLNDGTAHPADFRITK